MDYQSNELKTIKAADLFCGAGGTSTGLSRAVQKLGYKIDLLAINHWDVAILTHSVNHPDADHRCESLDNVDPRKAVPGGYLDLLVASPECFPAGTLILTEAGFKPIENVQPGDRVLTHKNRYKPVVSVMNKTGDTIFVTGQGHRALETTADHPFFSRFQIQMWNNAKRQYDTRILLEPDWLPAKMLSVRKVRWASPACFQHLPIPPVNGANGRTVTFNSQFWWMIGRWLGDGLVRLREQESNEITICCGKHKVAQLEAGLQFAPRTSAHASGDELHWRKREIRTSYLFECTHDSLASWIREHFGKGAHGKTVPAWVFSMSEEWRRSLLEGYVSSDGFRGDRFTSASSVSKALALGIRMLVTSLGYHPTFGKYHHQGGTIEGRPFDPYDMWVVRWENNCSQRTGINDGEHSWTLVKKLQEGRKGIGLFNLSVEEDESYVADGIVVHNCTHHSRARGGRPISDQSRASAWHILRWAEALYIENILIENVPEFRTWGPLNKDGQMVPSLKGKTFLAFIDALKSLGYNVDHRVVNAADYGDATSRKRLFILARRDKPVVWPEPTHAKAGSKDLFGQRKPWRPAREIIDWSLHGESIFTRKKPLAANTMRRIMKGLEKFSGLPFIIGQQSGNAPRSVEDPVMTITTTSRGMGFVEPFLVKFYGTNDAGDIDEPLPTVTAQGNHVGLAEPFLISVGGPEGQGRNPHSVDEPLGTVLTEDRRALVEPFLIMNYGQSNAGSIDEPLPTVTAKSEHIALCEPYLVQYHGSSYEGGERVKSVEDPLPTVATANQFALCEPYVVALNHGKDENRSYPLGEPMPTITSIDAWGLIEPYLVKYNGTGGAMPIDEPIDTITGKDRYGLVIPLTDGRQALVDIRFRMLQPHELAAGMGFPPEYQFVGKREDKVKQIGNAVPTYLAEALCNALLT